MERPRFFMTALRDLPPGWARIAGELQAFCAEELGVERGMPFRDLWQVIWRYRPQRLGRAIFPPGSAILERIGKGTDEEVLLDLLALARVGSLEGLEGKTVLAILKKHCPKPAEQKPITLRQRKERVAQSRRRSR